MSLNIIYTFLISQRTISGTFVEIGLVSFQVHNKAANVDNVNLYVKVSFISVTKRYTIYVYIYIQTK